MSSGDRAGVDEIARRIDKGGWPSGGRDAKPKVPLRQLLTPPFRFPPAKLGPQRISLLSIIIGSLVGVIASANKASPPLVAIPAIAAALLAFIILIGLLSGEGGTVACQPAT